MRVILVRLYEDESQCHLKKNVYLFCCARSQLWHAEFSLWHLRSLVVVYKLFISECKSQFPDQGSNPGHLHWEFQPLNNQGRPNLSKFLNRNYSQNFSVHGHHLEYARMYPVTKPLISAYQLSYQWSQGETALYYFLVFRRCDLDCFLNPR